MSTSRNPFITAPLAVLRDRGRSVVSAAMLHDDWMAAETDATLALVAWRSAPCGRKPAAYADYVAALDAEAAAAAQLERWLSANR
jgi:hypothetical protein